MTELQKLQKAITEIKQILNAHDVDQDPWSDSLEAIEDIVQSL